MSLQVSRPWKPGEHVCEIHSSATSLAHAVADFAVSGAVQGERVIAIVNADRVDTVRERLFELQPEQSRRVHLRDAQEMLRRFMRRGMPDPALFHAAVLPGLRRAVRDNHGRVRIYAEMVNALWQKGNPSAAVRLEELWNALAERHRITMLCGYLLDPLDPRSYTEHLQHVCSAHSRIINGDDEQRALSAIEEGCRRHLGFSPGAVLTQSRARVGDWEDGLSETRRTILWLLRNVPSMMPAILADARRCVKRSDARPERMAS